MSDLLTLLSVVAISIITLLLGHHVRKGKAKKGDGLLPENKAADIARGTIQQTFEDGISGISKDLKSDAPAQRLADRANARKRRK